MITAYRYGNWNPFSEMEKLQGEINRLFSDYGPGADGGTSNVPLRVYANEVDFAVICEVPGLKADQVSISVTGSTLSLSFKPVDEALPEGSSIHRRERHSGAFSRSIELPHRVDEQNIQAQIKNGMLMVRLPKTEADRPRQIKIQAS